MTSRTTLGLMGLLAAVLVVGGALAGNAVAGGAGSVLGLLAGFVVSGWLLRSYSSGGSGRREQAERQRPR